MPYISPLKLLKDYRLPVELKLDRDTMRLARQALLAEIDLSPRHTVKVGNSEMTRDDVLKMFDNLQAEGAFEYHEIIHRDPALLRFFTEGVLPSEPLADQPGFRDPGFIQFISDFYPELFSRNFADILVHPEFDKMNSLFQLPSEWISGPSQRQVHRQVADLIHKKVANLNNMVAKSQGKKIFPFRKEDAERYYHHIIIEALNRLPYQFVGLREHYGIQLLDLAYVMWNSGRVDDAHYVVRRIEEIKGTTELKRHIDHFWSQCAPGIEPAAQTVTQSESGGLSGWQIVAIIFAIIRLLMVFAR